MTDIDSLTPLDQYPADLREVVEWAVHFFGCAKARISRFSVEPSLFLIIGWTRHTRDMRSAVWRNEEGERIDFDFTEEQTIASGNSVAELKASAEEYKRVSQLKIEDFLREYLAKNP